MHETDVNAARQFEYATVPAVPLADDADLVRRVASSYCRAVEEFDGHGTSFWKGFEDRHSGFKEAFSSNDLASLGNLLRNPAETELHRGFDDLVAPYVKERSENPDRCHAGAQTMFDYLEQIAFGTGALRCPYPPQHGEAKSGLSVNEILESLDARFGFRIDFPNPFAHEFGLRTDRGIASYRAIQAIYQAWRVKQIALHVNGNRVLEIGAGLGRNAYHARKSGIEQYTIVDIPNTQLAQSYYLARIMGEQTVSFCAETDERPVRLRSPKWLSQTSEKFDVVINVDSLTEMDRDHALSYIKFARDKSRSFLSINHEFNAATVAQLAAEAGMAAIARSPYWPRPGYVEETFISQYGDDGEQLRAMRASTSWRVTAPLRALKSAIWH